MSSFEVSQQITATPFAQQLQTLKAAFTRQSGVIQTIVGEMENELDRMRNKGTSLEWIEKKDSQIEALVTFANTVDELVKVYSLMVINQRAEHSATTMMLWDALKSQQTAFEVLMKRLVTIPKHQRP
jgi:hypothetical protein